MYRSLFGCLVGILTLSLCPSFLEAQSFQVNTYTTGSQNEADLDMDANGNFTVVWTSGDQFGGTGADGDEAGISARRFAEDGTPLGDEFVVNTTTQGAQTDPGIGMDDAGNFVVTWRSYYAFSNSIQAQRYDASGAAVGGEFQVKNTSYNYSYDHEAAYADDGSFVVSWEESGNGVHAQRFDSSAVPQGGDITVSTGEDWTPALDVADDGSFVLAWQERFSGNIQVRRYDDTGTALGPEFNVGNGFDPDIALDPSDGFMVVWAVRTSPANTDAYGRRYDSSGVATGPAFLLPSDLIDEESNPTIDFASDGSYAVTWSDGGSPGPIEVRRFAADNTPLGPDQLLAVENNARFPRIRVQPDGDTMVVWDSNESDGDSRAIRGCLGPSCDGSSGTPEGLVAHWPLDEGAGAVAADSSDNGLDGTLEGGAGWTPGQQASGGLFDGVDDLIRIPDNVVDSPLDIDDALTIALWVRPDAIDGSIQVLVSKDDAYELEFGKAGAATWDVRLNNTIEFTGATPLEEGVWQHLAISWDGVDVCGYYNGLPDGCSSYSAMLLLNDDDVGLGGRPAPILEGGPVFHFAGALDEVYLFDSALSDTEIADLVLAELTDVFPPVRSNLAPDASLGAGTTDTDLGLDTDEAADCQVSTVAGTAWGAGTLFATTGGTSHSTNVPVSAGVNTFYVRCRDALGNRNNTDAVIQFGVGDSDLCSNHVAAWRLDEGAGCSTADESGANDGALGPGCPANAPSWVVGHTGADGALAYDGIDDQVSVPSPGGLSGAGSITLAAWVQHGTSGIFRSIVDHRDAGTDGVDLYLSAGSKAFLRVNSLTLEGNTVVADGQWHHVAGVYDGSELRIYVDGLLDASTAASATTLDVSAPLFLGRHFANTQFPFAGNLDEVAIYARGLNDVEILDLYQGRTCTP